MPNTSVPVNSTNVLSQSRRIGSYPHHFQAEVTSRPPSCGVWRGPLSTWRRET